MEAECGGYRIDTGPLAEARGARLIVLQLPDGLKPFSSCIARLVEEETGAEVIVHGDSTFGACDLQYPQLAATLDPDVIVHVGHTPYPPGLAHPRLEPRGRPRVVYLPARSVREPSPGTLEDAARILRGHGARRVVVVATSQHTHLLGRVAGALRDSGLEPIVPRGLRPFFDDGQVIGCDYRLALAGADANLIVSGGVFHGLGLYLATLRPTVKVDPYRDEAVDLTGMGERVYRLRLYKVSQAMDAKRWGVIIGLKTGQYRPWLVRRLVERIKASGREARLIAFEVLTEQGLRNIDEEWYEVFVVTSCPRIPVDDLSGYEKPVLTPGEAFMALEGRLEPYRFPW